MGPHNVAHKLIGAHLVAGRPRPGEEIALRVDQTLLQDATGTAVMLELDAMGLDRARTELSVQYVDHNVLQTDHRNADDHEFLRTAAARFGMWFSPAGNGVSHTLHQHHFGVPGKLLVGADSHTPAAGALGMLALAAGGIEVAFAIAGEPLQLRMPEIWGVELVGRLPPWVSAKDVILELLRRHGVEGAKGRVIEYFGRGVARLSAMDRHVIAAMGTELGAISTVFPCDDEVRRFLAAEGRERDWIRIEADLDAQYDALEYVDLSQLQPLVAMPSSPGNVRTVAEVAGLPIAQAYIGSTASPGFRDFAMAAEIVRGRRIHPAVSFDVNPTSRRILCDLARSGHLEALVEAGARIHQAGCNGCIGMGQAPATDALSLRTVPRNFPGRSGTREDKVCLVSPETAAASALAGCISDPRTLGSRMAHPKIEIPRHRANLVQLFVPPPPEAEARRIAIRRGPDIVPLPRFAALPQRFELPILLALPDDVSTDEILPAGARVMPHRSNIPRISTFAFEAIAPDYAARAAVLRDDGIEHAIVAGRNYGQGASRDHAALAPRFLGLRCVLARSFARIHERTLANYGIVPLVIGEDARELLRVGDVLVIENLHERLRSGHPIPIAVLGRDLEIEAFPDLSPRQIDLVTAGGLVALAAQRVTPHAATG